MGRFLHRLDPGDPEGTAEHDARAHRGSGKLSFEDTHLPGIIEQSRLTVPVGLEIDQVLDNLDMQNGTKS